MVDPVVSGGIFNWLILISFSFGVAIALGRFWALGRASINRRKFIVELTEALSDSDVNAAIAVCARRSTPLSNIIHAGLLRVGKGIRHVEHALATAGAIEMGMLEKNLIWLVSVVTVAPMLGFIGTVMGIIAMFQGVASTANLSPGVIAGGIAHALQSTVFGLTVGILMQLAHSFCVIRIDRIVADMEQSAQEFVDILVEKQIV